MIKNYLTTAFRYFFRNKLFALINISGLAVGISASLVIFLIVRYDFSFDTFHKTGDRIYRVVSSFDFQDDISYSSGVPVPMSGAVKKELSGLDGTAFFRTWKEEKKVAVPDAASQRPVVFKKQKNAVFVDADYFNLFSYRWLTGSPETALREPWQVVLTKSQAQTYFPGADPKTLTGRELVFDDTIRTTISGIVQDLEGNSDFNFTTFLSKATLSGTSLKPGDWEEWNNTNSASQLFVRLAKGKTMTAVEAQINALYASHVKRDPADHSKTNYSLQPLSDLHFNAEYDNFENRLAHKPTLYGLLAIAAFLLLLGCINFINLTTAQAMQRAKEIGIRKTIGGSKKQLVFQFLSETFLLTLVAMFLSVLITPLLFKAFADFIPQGLHYRLWQADVLLFLFLLLCSITVLSGFYPALVLSSFRPIAVLKNQLAGKRTRGGHIRLRKALFISQFVIAQFFIIATILVSKQIRYSIDKDLGYRKDAVLYFSVGYNNPVKTKKLQLLEKLKMIPEIELISLGYSNPTSRSMWTSTISYNDGKKDIESSVQITMGDTNYIRLYQMKLLAGENLPFSDTMNTVLINENYSKVLGFKSPQDAIGKLLSWNGMKTPIAGVLADFHQRSLHEPISPLVVANSYGSLRTFNVLLQPQNEEKTTWPAAIRKINTAWNELYPEEEINIQFIDETVARYYDAESHVSGLLLWASGLSVFISCLGLLGLVIYVTNQRTKEIGIRKVIGASVSQLVSLLAADFLRLIVIAFVIAVPVAWYCSSRWLENFAYRTGIDWWIFLAGGFVMLFIAAAIIVIRTYRVARVNPVTNMRSE